jgi:DNA-binding beta-propeller fold protein YncE
MNCFTGAPLFLGEGVAVDAAGNLFLADTGKRQVRKVSPDRSVSLVLGPPELSMPTGLAADGAGQLFIADSQRHRVLRVGLDGSLSTVAGTGFAGCSGDGGAAPAAQLNGPWGLAIDPGGNLYIADAANHRVRRVTPEGIIATVAGTGTPGFSGDGGPATLARLDRPLDLTVDSQGTLFIVDSLNGRVRRVGRDGMITTVFSIAAETGGGGSMPYYPACVAVDGEGNLLVADPFHHRIFRVSGVAAPGLIAGQPFPTR